MRQVARMRYLLFVSASLANRLQPRSPELAAQARGLKPLCPNLASAALLLEFTAVPHAAAVVDGHPAHRVGC